MSDTKQYPAEEYGRPARAAYQKPTLMEFGSVGVLTQAGTGTMTELMINMMVGISMMRNRP